MPRILVADGFEILRDGLRSRLSAAFPGLVVGEAATPQEASAQLEGSTWDAMILDVNLPGRGGLDLLAEAKRRWPAMAVLVLSAYPEEEFGLRCLRLGADGYVEKSCRSGEIVGAVQRILAGGKYVSPVVAEQLASAAQRSISAVPHHLLSARELQVLRLVAAGRTLREISAELQLGERTIATYRARLREKLGVSSNVEITRYALRHNLVD